MPLRPLISPSPKSLVVVGGSGAGGAGGRAPPAAVKQEPKDLDDVETTSAPQSEDEPAGGGRAGGVSDVDSGDLVPPMRAEDFNQVYLIILMEFILPFSVLG